MIILVGIILIIVGIVTMLIGFYFKNKENKKCKHKNRTEKFRYYPDRYIIDKCNDCGEEIYEEI